MRQSSYNTLQLEGNLEHNENRASKLWHSQYQTYWRSSGSENSSWDDHSDYHCSSMEIPCQHSTHPMFYPVMALRCCDRTLTKRWFLGAVSAAMSRLTERLDDCERYLPVQAFSCRLPCVFEEFSRPPVMKVRGWMRRMWNIICNRPWFHWDAKCLHARPQNHHVRLKFPYGMICARWGQLPDRSSWS